MRLPALLSRRNPNVHKNTFGHVLVLAGSPGMLGAASLVSLAAMRAGAGLVTVGVPKSLNLTLQKKISPVIMTLPLPETKAHTLSFAAYEHLRNIHLRFQSLAIGPGLSQTPATQKLIHKIIASAALPMVIDADALNALAGHLNILRQNSTIKILTPHLGEISRLTGLTKNKIENNRKNIAQNFARTYKCILVLKGPATIVAGPQGKIYTNKTGNAGMATAGSGDVLTGILAAFLAQGLSGFDAAKYAVYFHGKAGDLAVSKQGKTSLIAVDIIDKLGQALQKS